ncbi:MAG: polyketide cyclase [Chitinophagales bacterium]|nr:polyketide cyclase [Chitinophagales bacterium]
MKHHAMNKQFYIAFLSTLLYLFAGLALLYGELIGYGVALFAILPFAAGYAQGAARLERQKILGALSALFLTLLILLIVGWEGIVCILMSLPLVLPSFAVGALIRSLLTRKRDGNDKPLQSTLLPLLTFLIAAWIETQVSAPGPEIIPVRSAVVLPGSTMAVYNAIKSVDAMDAEKPFLLRIDLPVPQKCVLEKESVGGLRTCYFEGGQIVEKITELEPGKTLRMDVIDYQLTGRTWLGFKEAIYQFEALDDKNTKMTRITTYTSSLHPRFYWEPLERLGIEQEHEFIFRHLKKALSR